jgi:hypothetical protein
MRDVKLNPGIPGGKWARLRPLCGYDETFVGSGGDVDVVAFLDRLLAPAAGTAVGPGSAAQLSVSDCDKLCAAIFREYFGDRIEGRAVCSQCHESFEMRFSLAGLIEDLSGRQPDIQGPDEKGIFTAPDGRRFRLPTAAEQQELSGLSPDDAAGTLLSACVVSGDARVDPNVIENAMSEAGAVLDLDLNAVCPHCDAVQTVRFDMQSYLFHALGNERQFVIYEVHRIASAYGWACGDTLALPREDRRKFVQLIESERVARRRPSAWMGI